MLRATMDDIRFGAAMRAARVRRGWRQSDLAATAGVSESTVSRFERGHLDAVQVKTLRAIARVLDIRVELLPRSRGADLDRLLNARHTALTEAVVRWWSGFGGWTIRPELSFAHFGERGVIDVVGWHAGRQALLEVELKTDIVDSGELLGTIDRRRRLGRAIVEPLAWEPATVSTLLVIGESSANRVRVRSLGATFDAALPDRIAAVRRYLEDPAEELRGLMFFADRHPGQVMTRFAAARRVRKPGATAKDRKSPSAGE
jgi:transcriptional regulator with XRE-family HTH domain